MSKRKDIEYVYARTWIGRESMSPADEHIWELGRISGIREAASYKGGTRSLPASPHDLRVHASKLKRRLK